MAESLPGDAPRPFILTTSNWHRAWFEEVMGVEACDFFPIDDRDDHVFEKSLHALEGLVRRSGAFPPIITSTDSSMFAHAWVAERLGVTGKGASLAAMSVSQHKYLTRRLVEGCDGIRFAKVLRTDETLPRMDGVEIAILKPVASVGSAGVETVRPGAVNPLASAIAAPDLYTAHLSDVGEDIDDIVGVMEEYISPEVRKVTCDVFVSNGGVFQWAISDNVYRENQPEVFDCLVCPTVRLTGDEQLACHRRLEVVTRSLHRRFGLDNQFVCVEMFVFDADRVEVMEVNGRISANQMPAFARCLDDGDPIAAMVALQTGRRPAVPRPNGLHGVAFYRRSIDGMPEIVTAEGGDLVYYRRQAQDCHIYSFHEDSETAMRAGNAWYDLLSTSC